MGRDQAADADRGEATLRPAARQAAGSTPVAFVVRVVRDETGRLAGVVERIRTGEKERFHDAAAIGPLITRMLGNVPEGDVRSKA